VPIHKPTQSLRPAHSAVGIGHGPQAKPHLSYTGVDSSTTVTLKRKLLVMPGASTSHMVPSGCNEGGWVGGWV
jgi:hypothetical protein